MTSTYALLMLLTTVSAGVIVTGIGYLRLRRRVRALENEQDRVQGIIDRRLEVDAEAVPAQQRLPQVAHAARAGRGSNHGEGDRACGPTVVARRKADGGERLKRSTRELTAQADAIARYAVRMEHELSWRAGQCRRSSEALERVPRNGPGHPDE